MVTAVKILEKSMYLTLVLTNHNHRWVDCDHLEE